MSEFFHSLVEMTQTVLDWNKNARLERIFVGVSNVMKFCSWWKMCQCGQKTFHSMQQSTSHSSAKIQIYDSWQDNLCRIRLKKGNDLLNFQTRPFDPFVSQSQEVSQLDLLMHFSVHRTIFASFEWVQNTLGWLQQKESSVYVTVPWESMFAPVSAFPLP